MDRQTERTVYKSSGTPENRRDKSKFLATFLTSFKLFFSKSPLIVFRALCYSSASRNFLSVLNAKSRNYDVHRRLLKC